MPRRLWVLTTPVRPVLATSFRTEDGDTDFANRSLAVERHEPAFRKPVRRGRHPRAELVQAHSPGGVRQGHVLEQLEGELVGARHPIDAVFHEVGDGPEDDALAFDVAQRRLERGRIERVEVDSGHGIAHDALEAQLLEHCDAALALVSHVTR